MYKIFKPTIILDNDFEILNCDIDAIIIVDKKCRITIQDSIVGLVLINSDIEIDSTDSTVNAIFSHKSKINGIEPKLKIPFDHKVVTTLEDGSTITTKNVYKVGPHWYTDKFKCTKSGKKYKLNGNYNEKVLLNEES